MVEEGVTLLEEMMQPLANKSWEPTPVCAFLWIHSVPARFDPNDADVVVATTLFEHAVQFNEQTYGDIWSTNPSAGFL
jgi:hypothetical protein